MSDYANLREAYYTLLNAPPDIPLGMQAMIDADRELWKNRNPDPKPEPALEKARTQAEWHLVQQALADSEDPDEERAKAELLPAVVAGREGKLDTAAHAKRREQAKKTLEEMRQGKFPISLVGESAPAERPEPTQLPADQHRPQPTQLPADQQRNHKPR